MKELEIQNDRIKTSGEETSESKERFAKIIASKENTLKLTKDRLE